MQQLLLDNWLNVHAVLKKTAKDVSSLSNQIPLAQNFAGLKKTTVSKINDWVKIKLFFKIMIKHN